MVLLGSGCLSVQRRQYRDWFFSSHWPRCRTHSEPVSIFPSPLPPPWTSHGHLSTSWLQRPPCPVCQRPWSLRAIPYSADSILPFVPLSKDLPMMAWGVRSKLWYRVWHTSPSLTSAWHALLPSVLSGQLSLSLSNTRHKPVSTSRLRLEHSSPLSARR